VKKIHGYENIFNVIKKNQSYEISCIVIKKSFLVCVFITTVTITKLFARRGGGNGVHVLRTKRLRFFGIKKVDF
jgi:hypothetical protein